MKNLGILEPQIEKRYAYKEHVLCCNEIMVFSLKFFTSVSQY